MEEFKCENKNIRIELIDCYNGTGTTNTCCDYFPKYFETWRDFFDYEHFYDLEPNENPGDDDERFIN